MTKKSSDERIFRTRRGRPRLEEGDARVKLLRAANLRAFGWPHWRIGAALDLGVDVDETGVRRSRRAREYAVRGARLRRALYDNRWRVFRQAAAFRVSVDSVRETLAARMQAVYEAARQELARRRRAEEAAAVRDALLVEALLRRRRAR
ncbi:MAG: hypothetical protein ACRDHY_17180 [Anaerolineales bacterium]